MRVVKKTSATPRDILLVRIKLFLLCQEPYNMVIQTISSMLGYSGSTASSWINGSKPPGAFSAQVILDGTDNVLAQGDKDTAEDLANTPSMVANYAYKAFDTVFLGHLQSARNRYGVGGHKLYLLQSPGRKVRTKPKGAMNGPVAE